MVDEDQTEAELDALEDLEHAVEHLYRAYGSLVECHHETGRAMDKVRDAEVALRDAGHDRLADRARDDLLPAGVVDDYWTYELVEAYRDGTLADVADFDATVREQLADGEEHIVESALRRKWRDRAER